MPRSACLLVLLLAACSTLPAGHGDPGEVHVVSHMDAAGNVTDCEVRAPGVVGHDLTVSGCKEVHVSADQHTTDSLSGIALAIIAMVKALVP